MPTITNPPVLVDPVNFSRQSGTEINPFMFQVGSNVYLVFSNIQVPAIKRISIYKSTDHGVTWTEKDSANAPTDVTWLVPYLDPNDNNIYIGYIDPTPGPAYKMVEFNTTTDTYGTPSSRGALTANTAFWFCRRNNGDGIVFTNSGTDLVYDVCSAGVWSGATTIFSVAGIGLVEGGLYEVATGAFSLVICSNSVLVHYARIASDFSSPGPIALSETWSSVFARPTLVLYSTDSIAVGYAPLSGADWVVVEIGTPRSAPVFTRYGVFVAPDVNEADSYVTVKVDDLGALNVFWCRVNVNVNPLIDEIDQSTFNGTTWSANTTYYDEITNSPAQSVAQINQFVHTLDLVEVPNGWLGATAMEIDNGINQYCAGFVLDPNPPGTQTLELTKIVVGGPAVPGDWNLSAETGSPPTGISGAGHVGPSEVDAATYELDEVAFPGITFDSTTGTWQDDAHTWGGDYAAGAWDCGGATMPTPTSVVVPSGGTVACTITNTFIPTPPPPPPPGPGNGEENPVGCWELLRVDVTLMPSRHLPTRGSVK